MRAIFTHITWLEQNGGIGLVSYTVPYSPFVAVHRHIDWSTNAIFDKIKVWNSPHIWLANLRRNVLCGMPLVFRFPNSHVKKEHRENKFHCRHYINKIFKSVTIKKAVSLQRWSLQSLMWYCYRYYNMSISQGFCTLLARMLSTHPAISILHDIKI